jgi:hypothetical protein
MPLMIWLEYHALLEVRAWLLSCHVGYLQAHHYLAATHARADTPDGACHALSSQSVGLSASLDINALNITKERQQI